MQVHVLDLGAVTRLYGDIPGFTANVFADFQCDRGREIALCFQCRKRGLARTAPQSRDFAAVLVFGQSGNGLDRSIYGLQCRSEEHTSEVQSLMRISYAVFCLKKKKKMQV